jgi:hypothetical protein
MKAKIIKNSSNHGFSVGELIDVESFSNDDKYFTTVDPFKWKIYILHTDLEIVKES